MSDKPKETHWIPLGNFEGTDYGFSIAVWESSISLQKMKKISEGKWESTSKITIPHGVMPQLAILLPKYYDMTKKVKEK